MKFQQGLDIYINLVIVVVIVIVCIKVYQAAHKALLYPRGTRLTIFLLELGLPTSFERLLIWLGAFFLFTIIARFIGSFPALVLIAIFMGWQNGFFTKRKNRP